MKISPSIVLIGAGNLAYHLGLRLAEKKHRVRQVFSRGREKAERLALEIKCAFTTQLSQIDPEADLYILAVHDSAIEEVAAKIKAVISTTALVVHTSGATPSTVLRPHFQRYGVFYPLQSFSISRPAKYEQIPICVDAVESSDLALLTELALDLSPHCHSIDDAQRAILHVAAVFVNNFSNHLFHIGADILEREQLPFDLLRPLIAETASKVQQQLPQQMQTGPAIRGDQNTIRQHLAYLAQFPAYSALYEQISRGINPELPKIQD